MNASGWSRTDSARACADQGVTGQGETYARYRNGIFCATIDTRVYFWPTYARGLKNGSLVGTTNNSKSGGCTALLAFRSPLVRAQN